MFLKSFEHQLASGENAKFSIFESYDNGIKYYHAKVVGTDIDTYKNLTDELKKVSYGIDMRQGGNKIIYRTDLDQFINDIKEKYGTDDEIASDL